MNLEPIDERVDDPGFERTLALAAKVMAHWAPPPKLTVSEWADDRRILPDTSPEPGRWRTSRIPYGREIMDSVNDPRWKRIVMKMASQLGKSEILLCIAGYYMDYDPAPMMLMQPTIDLARDFSKERFGAMIRDTPTLAAKVSEVKSRDSDNTILNKKFPGGYAVLVGANAPSSLASRPIRILLPDEVDRFPMSAGSEGDPLSLAQKRQSNFWNARLVICSTPTVKGESRIEAEYESSTQERWSVPCPSCEELQPYEWDRLDFANACMACRECGALHSEFEWKARQGSWVAEAEHPTCRGFHVNALASPWLRWRALIDEFHDARAKGPEVLQTFVNTRLAEAWDEQGETAADEETLEARREWYECDVPKGVMIMTAGVDVQQDRLEAEIVGWGAGGESWGITYRQLMGDPRRTEVWHQLDALLQTAWRRADGRVLQVSCACVDSGYATTEVYSYTRPRRMKSVFAIKGRGGPGLPEVAAFSRQGKGRDVAVFPVGSDSSKDTFMSRLGVAHAGPGRCHWPRELDLADGSTRGYGSDYYKALMAERRVERKSQGRVYHAWVKRSGHARNEALDCRVYASAALRILNPNWKQLADADAHRARPAPAAQAQPRRVHSRGVEV